MASHTAEPIVVPLQLDAETLTKQLSALRVLVSQIGFALDTAILAINEAAHNPQDRAHPTGVGQ